MSFPARGLRAGRDSPQRARRRRITLPAPGLTACLVPSLNWKESMPRPPNYKQQKQRREEEQKKRNEAKQREIAERKKPPADPQPP